MSEYKYIYDKDKKEYQKNHNCSDKEHSIKLDFQGERVTYYFKNIGTYHKFKDAYENKLFYVADSSGEILSDVNIEGSKLEEVLKKVLNKNSDYVNKILGIIFKNLKQKSLGVRGRDQSELSVKGSEEDYIPKLNRDIQKTKEFKNFTGAIKSRTSGRFYFCKKGKIQTATLYRFKIEGLNKEIDDEDKSPFINYLRKMEWGYPNPTKSKYKDLYNKYELARIEKAGPPSRKKEEKGSEETKGDERSNYGTVSFLNRAQKFRVYFKSSKILGDDKYTYQTFVINSNDLPDILELTSGHKVESIKVPNKAAGRNTLKSFDISTIIHYSDAKSNYLDYEEIPFKRQNLHSFKKKSATSPATTPATKTTPTKTIYKTIEELPGWKEAAKNSALEKRGANVKPSGKISVYIPTYNYKLVNAELAKTEDRINGFDESFFKIQSGNFIDEDKNKTHKLNKGVNSYILFDKEISSEIIDGESYPTGVYKEEKAGKHYFYRISKDDSIFILFENKHEGMGQMSEELSSKLFKNEIKMKNFYYRDYGNEELIEIILDGKEESKLIKELFKYNNITYRNDYDKLDLLIKITSKKVIKHLVNIDIQNIDTVCDNIMLGANIGLSFLVEEEDEIKIKENKIIESIEDRDCTKIKIIDK